MGKYSRYKNRIEMFLSSEGGKRLLNFWYSWGASVVVIGAMFKIVHLPYANEILCVALITEALVFFISAFERPSSDYNWEEVFPVLKSKNPLDRPDFERRDESGALIVGGGATGGGTVVVGNFEGSPVAGGNMQGGRAYVGGVSGVTPQQSAEIGLAAMGLNVSEEDRKNLAESIRKLSEAAEQIAHMGDLSEMTKSYIEQLSGVAHNLEKFNDATRSLSSVSDSLVSSCNAISGAAAEGESGESSLGYVQRMEQLNRHISDLGQFYEAQLSGLRTQMDTIHHINAGLNRIRDMYDSSMIDSAAFRNENERMAQLLTQLNQVYGRMLQAMTVNMPYGAPYPQQQPPYQGGAPYPAR
ncbi:MAG: gliding motility protein GldL [Tannerella sp.]|jgi:methyl-accepting chemotaxis protein|nr:gliding motility protein GldL [Tannerella sp.]